MYGTTTYRLLGLQVHVNDASLPKLQMSPELGKLLKPEFVEEFNAWALDFFGSRKMIRDGEMWQTPHHVIMNSVTYQQLRERLPMKK